MAPHYRIERDGRGAFRFVFVATARPQLFASVAFPTLEATLHSLDRLRSGFARRDWAQRQASPDGADYWFDVIAEGLLLGSSVLYPSRFARELAIEQMELDGPGAPLVERD